MIAADIEPRSSPRWQCGTRTAPRPNYEGTFTPCSRLAAWRLNRTKWRSLRCPRRTAPAGDLMLRSGIRSSRSRTTFASMKADAEEQLAGYVAQQTKSLGALRGHLDGRD